jgi:hypothetical protein
MDPRSAAAPIESQICLEIDQLNEQFEAGRISASVRFENALRLLRRVRTASQNSSLTLSNLGLDASPHQEVIDRARSATVSRAARIA